MKAFGITIESRSCAECGKPLPEDSPRRTRFCRVCLKKHRAQTLRNYRLANLEKVRKEGNETYHYYRERGICINCRAEKALPGRPMCERCTEKRAEYQRKYWKKYKRMKKA